MLRYNDIVTGLLHLVGWQQGYTGGVQIDNDLTTSQSGIYFQQVHPLMTLENIRSIAPEFTTVDGTETAFSSWLQEKTKASIYKAISRFCTEKANQQAYKQLVESKELFSGTGNIYDTEAPNNKLVGFEIVPVRSRGITTKIEKIGLQFTKAGSYKLYLFHSSSYEPIYSQVFETTKPNTFVWLAPTEEWMLRYNTVDAGGSWYLCYNQDDLPEGMEAINVAKDWSREPCGTCNIGSVEAWRELTKYLAISPFRVPALQTFAEYPELWDIADNVYTNTCNYGLNVEVSVACDLTDFIIREREVFATTLQRQVAVTALRTMAMNPNVRVNRNQSNVSTQGVLYELDGNPQGRENGMGMELRKAYEALDIDTRGIDRICLTCRPVGLRYRTV